MQQVPAYQYQEYPKALYRQGVYLAVAGIDEEEAARAEGYDDWAADQAAADQAVQTSAIEPVASPQKRTGSSKSNKSAEGM